MAENLEPLDPYLNKGRAKRRQLVRRFITRPVISTVVRPTVLGEDNVADLEGGFVMIPNHSSHLDAPMVFSLLPDSLTERLATGAAADYFYRRKFISSLTSLFFNTYPIERKSKRPGPAAGMTGRLLRAGVPILVFPRALVRVTARWVHLSRALLLWQLRRGFRSFQLRCPAVMRPCPWVPRSPKWGVRCSFSSGSRCTRWKVRKPNTLWIAHSTPSR